MIIPVFLALPGAGPERAPNRGPRKIPGAAVRLMRELHETHGYSCADVCRAFPQVNPSHVLRILVLRSRATAS